MTYLKSFLINFLTVFFVNHLLPGIQTGSYAKLPKIEGGLIFALAVGFVNSLVFPMMRLLNVPLTAVKIGLASFIVSFGAYAIVNIIPVGIKVLSMKGFLWSASIVWVISYFTNYLEFARYRREMENKISKSEKTNDGDKK